MDSASRTVFVTVGTTRFDDLVKEVLRPDVQKELHRRGYSRMIVQFGNSELEWPKEKGKHLLQCTFILNFFIRDYVIL